MTDKHSYVVITLLVLLLALAPAAVAQAAPSGQTPTPTPEGIDHGGYNIQQSIEIGYRHTDVSGVGADNSMFNTFINLQTGPRLLEQTFSMRSLNRSAGLLFDDLFVNSFGWGGDPNNAARMRMSKYKWYNFSASFRRDQNYFDYNLLVNPLQATPHVNFSPHMFQVRRRMADLNLTLAPQSKFSVRLGYSRNRADGPTLSTIHGAVDGLLSSPWSTTYSNYQVGFDMKFIPKTNISFDQFLEYGKNDTDASLDPFQSLPFQAAVGGFTSLEFGLPPATASSTCVLTNPLGCTGFTSYSRMQRVRTSTPTSQLSFQSHPHQKVAPRTRVEPGARLIEQQHGRFVEQRFGQLRAALQSSRELLDALGGALGEPQTLQHGLRASLEPCAVQAVQVAVASQVLMHRELVVEARVLEDDTEVAADRGRCEVQGIAEDVGRASGCWHQRRQDFEECGLAATVGPEQSEDLAARDAEAHVVECDARSVHVAEVLDLYCFA